MAGWSGVGIPLGARDFLFHEMSRPALGPTQPFIVWLMGFFPAGKVTMA